MESRNTSYVRHPSFVYITCFLDLYPLSQNLNTFLVSHFFLIYNHFKLISVHVKANLKFDEYWLRKFGESEQVLNSSLMSPTQGKPTLSNGSSLRIWRTIRIDANYKDLDNIL